MKKIILAVVFMSLFNGGTKSYGASDESNLVVAGDEWIVTSTSANLSDAKNPFEKFQLTSKSTGKVILAFEATDGSKLQGVKVFKSGKGRKQRSYVVSEWFNGHNVFVIRIFDPSLHEKSLIYTSPSFISYVTWHAAKAGIKIHGGPNPDEETPLQMDSSGDAFIYWSP